MSISQRPNPETSRWFHSPAGENATIIASEPTAALRSVAAPVKMPAICLLPSLSGREACVSDIPLTLAESTESVWIHFLAPRNGLVTTVGQAYSDGPGSVL